MTIEQSGSQEGAFPGHQTPANAVFISVPYTQKNAATHVMAGSLNSLTKFLVNRQGVNLDAFVSVPA
jgi:hypothetical protein